MVEQHTEQQPDGGAVAGQKELDQASIGMLIESFSQAAISVARVQDMMRTLGMTVETVSGEEVSACVATPTSLIKAMGLVCEEIDKTVYDHLVKAVDGYKEHFLEEGTDGGTVEEG